MHIHVSIIRTWNNQGQSPESERVPIQISIVWLHHYMQAYNVCMCHILVRSGAYSQITLDMFWPWFVHVIHVDSCGTAGGKVHVCLPSATDEVLIAKSLSILFSVFFFIFRLPIVPNWSTLNNFKARKCYQRDTLKTSFSVRVLRNQNLKLYHQNSCCWWASYACITKH